jgi:hypothetical protein
MVQKRKNINLPNTNFRISVKPKQNKHKEAHHEHLIIKLVKWQKIHNEKEYLQPVKEDTLYKGTVTKQH